MALLQGVRHQIDLTLAQFLERDDLGSRISQGASGGHRILVDVLRSNNQGDLGVGGRGGQGRRPEKRSPDNNRHKQCDVGSAAAEDNCHEQQQRDAQAEPRGQIIEDESQASDVGNQLVESHKHGKAKAQEDDRDSCQDS